MKTISTNSGRVYKMTDAEFKELVTALSRMVEWGEGGMYGDGEEIVDRKGIVSSAKLLMRINKS